MARRTPSLVALNPIRARLSSCATVSNLRITANTLTWALKKFLLPIESLLPQILDALAQKTNLVLQAPPGAGKTTQVPLALLDAPWLANKKILMLEPRRLAARAAARFMARALNEDVGATVGYRVRLDTKVSARTRIEVITEGILTRLLQDDAALENVGVIIFDEFHERSLHADLGLALCLDVQAVLRADLRIVVMSATLDGTAVARVLGDAAVLTSEGRSFPVEHRYRPMKTQLSRDRKAYLQEITHTLLTVLEEDTGSLLMFLPGTGEIRQVEAALKNSSLPAEILIAPLYGALSGADQDAAIQPAPAGKRKIVLATSIAESSLTIEGISIVVDSGLMRVPRFDPNTGFTELVTLNVSEASADQRCGRAGRLQSGICYRLWSEHQHLLPQSTPEIVEADLAPLLLELALWGVREPMLLRWLDPPPLAHVSQARELLQQLGTLDSVGVITAHGRAMAKLGTHPRLAHMMLRAKALGVGQLACEIAALLEERDLFRGPAARAADFTLRLEVLLSRAQARDVDFATLKRVQETAKQWQQQLQLQRTPEEPALSMTGVLLAFAYPDRIAQRRRDADRRYLLSNGRGAYFVEGEPLSSAAYVVAAQVDGAREARIYLACQLSRDDITQYHSDLIREQTLVVWDAQTESVLARKQLVLGKIVLSDEPWSEANLELIQEALVQGIRQRGLTCLPWSEAARSLQARINFLHRVFPLQWPDYSDAVLLETLEEWLSPYLNGAMRLTHVQRINLAQVLLAQLAWDKQQQLNELAPTHLTVPSGSQIPLDYDAATPVLAVRLQELFGLTETPRIAGGTVPLLIHLLSPARRPVQITQDLAGFWKTAYHEVKKDLKGRYPKHHWPDNPLEAAPTARAKKTFRHPRKSGDLKN